MGIEPIFFAWKAKDLPLIYIRIGFWIAVRSWDKNFGKQSLALH